MPEGLATVPGYQDMVCVTTDKAQGGRDSPGKLHSGPIHSLTEAHEAECPGAQRSGGLATDSITGWGSPARAAPEVTV